MLLLEGNNSYMKWHLKFLDSILKSPESRKTPVAATVNPYDMYNPPNSSRKNKQSN